VYCVQVNKHKITNWKETLKNRAGWKCIKEAMVLTGLQIHPRRGGRRRKEEEEEEEEV